MKGFTLIEMLTVFLILGVVSFIGVSNYQAALRKGEIESFISELQTALTPVVYGQGSIRSSGYSDLNNFTQTSLSEYAPTTNGKNGGVRGIVIKVGTISLFNKIGNYSPSESNSFYYNQSNGDIANKTIVVPPSIIFDSVCTVADSHANCETTVDANSITQVQGGLSIAYHGLNERPYVALINSVGGGAVMQSGKGLRLNFKSPLEAVWYTITLSPYGGMIVGRRCATQVCL